MAKILLNLSVICFDCKDITASLKLVDYLVYKTECLQILKNSFELVELEVYEYLIQTVGNLMTLGSGQIKDLGRQNYEQKLKI
jgi:hypothetical protein